MSVASLPEFKRRTFNVLRTHVLVENEHEGLYACEAQCCGWVGETHGQFNAHLTDIITALVDNSMVVVPPLIERVRKYMLASPEPFHTPAEIAHRLGEDPHYVAETLEMMADVRLRISLNSRYVGTYRLIDNGLTTSEVVSANLMRARQKAEQIRSAVRRVFQ